MFHLNLCPFDLPLVWLWTQTKHRRLVFLWYWVLKVSDKTGRLLGMVVDELCQRVEPMLSRYIQLPEYDQNTDSTTNA